ncbi:MAG: hypothetical protein ABW360_12675 [Phenylobacterium sp.]
MQVQSVTFFPIPPIKPIAYPRPDAPVDEKAPAQRVTSSSSHTGRVFDFKV